MKIYQPMLFVGLGGTGCRVGAELERRLREELCGPDGTLLQRVMQGKKFLPYQLPSCTQFVYADLNADEFGRLEQRVVPDRAHLPAAERTMHRVTDLVPTQDTYPELARSLRLNAGAYVDGWLPPPQDEPLIGPLARGAGQLPTVGRAALFETFRNGLAPVQDSLIKAIGEIQKAGGELELLGGEKIDSCDVFVAFSVAGGTGGGLYYDYLHLIGDAFHRNSLGARIFPLVLMPSAFEEGLGGGRPARLNAGRALLDLFRLVDDQNAQPAGTNLDREGVTGTVSISYPGREKIRLRASTVQTAFLFSRGAGVRRDDLHRSVVSLILTMIGTELGVSERNAVRSVNYQSFADSFINEAATRELPAATGIGNRGVSTSSVASMTIPVEDLADIVSSRLLAEAVYELNIPPPGRAEDNVDLIDRFFTESNLDPFRLRAPLPITEPRPGKGAVPIVGALNTRARTMESRLVTLSQQLAQEVPKLAERFDTEKACRSLLAEIDIFRLRRVVLGHPDLVGPVNQQGVKKLVESRQSEPPPPEGLTVATPALTDIRNRWLVKKAKWADKEVRESVRRQDEWYGWRAKREWHQAWRDQAARWQPKLRSLEKHVSAVVTAFIDQARIDNDRFTARSEELYEARVGVSYLLPRQGELEAFYRSVVRRFVDIYVTEGKLLPTATIGDLVTEMLRDGGWRRAYETSIDHPRGAAAAVAHVRDQLKAEVKRRFAHRDGEHRPMVAALGDLLKAAVNIGDSTEPVDEDDLIQFREKLAGLVPGGFAPGGTGRLKILFSYPSPVRNDRLERFLRQEVYLPREVDTIIDFRPITAESIAVVMFRSSMGITEVPEVREVLRHWSDALRHGRREDFLRWRQRCGYQFGYLATTPEHRARILHHLLCAVWNGDVMPTPNPTHPERIDVDLSGVTMKLQLDSFQGLSSWADSLKAYEDWVLADDNPIRLSSGAKLISTLPNGLGSNPVQQHSLFDSLMKLKDGEKEKIERMLERPTSAGRRRLASILEFWDETFPAAMGLTFSGIDEPVEDNLGDLYSLFRNER